MTSRELDAIGAAVRVELGVLPCPGGWQDQPATFCQAWPIIMREVEHWRKVARDKAIQQSKGKR